MIQLPSLLLQPGWRRSDKWNNILCTVVSLFLGLIGSVIPECFKELRMESTVPEAHIY